MPLVVVLDNYEPVDELGKELVVDLHMQEEDAE